MAFAKTEGFDPKTVQLAEFAAALSHPARISLLQHLLLHPGCRCTELVNATPLSQPSCSRHLAELRKAGLVEAEQHGNEIHYRLVRDHIQRFCEAFHSTLNPE